MNHTASYHSTVALETKRTWLAGIVTLLVLAGVASSVQPPYKLVQAIQFGTARSELSYGMAVDGAGDPYVTGYTYGSLSGESFGGSDAFLAKYGPSGSPIWVRQLGSAGSDNSHSVAVDAAGNSFITGDTNGALFGPSAGAWDSYIARYDSSGNLSWAHQFGSPIADHSNVVAADTFGNCYVGGNTYGSLYSTHIGPGGDLDAVLAKYDEAGRVVWAKQFGTASDDEVTGIVTDHEGDVYVTGPLGGSPSGGFDSFVHKYDSAGNLVWSQQFGVSGSPSDKSSSIAIDAAGNLYITGFTSGSLGAPHQGVGSSWDAFLIKFDGTGKQQWIRQFGTGGNDGSYGVGVDGSGHVFVSGYVCRTIYGGDADHPDVFLASFDDAGNLLWSRQLGAWGDDFATGLATTSSGDLYIDGYTENSLAGPNLGLSDTFLMKYHPVAALPGDADFDGSVSFADYLALEANFGKTAMSWEQGDFNNDGTVTFSDYLLLEANFGKTIPEPATLSLLALGGLMIRRRHK